MAPVTGGFQLSTFAMSIKIIGLCSPAPGSGKSTVASYLEDYGWEIVPFASTLKRMLKAMLMEIGYSMCEAEELILKKEYIVPELGVRIRTLMQTLGTEWGREKIEKRFWIKCWEAKVKSLGSFVVADDVRFLNEAMAIKEMGGEIWKIIRPGTENGENHSSEGQLDHWDGFSRVIVNDGSIQDLRDRLSSFLINAEGQK
jgi:hypothetical protein